MTYRLAFLGQDGNRADAPRRASIRFGDLNLTDPGGLYGGRSRSDPGEDLQVDESVDP